LLGVKYSFAGRRLGTKLGRLLVAVLWLLAFSFSVVSFVLSGVESEFYKVSEICVGLPISKLKVYDKSSVATYIGRTEYAIKYWNTTYHYEGSRVSMYLSTTMFTGLNLVCFLIVGFCYTSIFITARKSSKDSGRSQRSDEELRMAMKMSLLVITDFCCWVPIGILSILVQADAVEVSPRAYAWIATFVLPINSTLNPFLYTFAGYVFDKVKCSCRDCRDHEVNTEMNEIAGQTNRTDDKS
jgi:amino acid transporter